MNKQLITVIEEPVGIVIKPPAFVPRNYMIVETRSGNWTARTPDNEIIDYAPTSDLAEKLCAHHAADKLRELARANGYVKLEPGQCVVQRDLLVDAHTLLVINNCDCNPCTRVKRDLLAALDASGVPK